MEFTEYVVTPHGDKVTAEEIEFYSAVIGLRSDWRVGWLAVPYWSSYNLTPCVLIHCLFSLSRIRIAVIVVDSVYGETL